MVWTAAVAPHFDRSRALALAIALSGLGLGAALTPVVVGSTQVAYGWRAAYAITALGWVAIVFPLVYLFFERTRGGPTIRSVPPELLSRDLRSPIFIRLALAGFAMTFAVLGLYAHLVPILTERSVDREAAVWISGLIGLGSIVGRIGTGYCSINFKRRSWQRRSFCCHFLDVS